MTPNALKGIRFVVGRNFGVVGRGWVGEGVGWGFRGYFTLMPCVNLGYTNFQLYSCFENACRFFNVIFLIVDKCYKNEVMLVC